MRSSSVNARNKLKVFQQENHRSCVQSLSNIDAHDKRKRLQLSRSAVIVLFSLTLVSPWSPSCQRSCTPSLRTNWTGTSPRGNARRRRKRRGTVSTRRSMTKRWRPQRSRCSPLKLSYCQRRYWKSDPHQKLGHVCLLVFTVSALPLLNLPQ